MKQIPQRPGDISERSLYWLAGLLEGEGSFLQGPPSSPGLPLIRMVMIDRDVIDRAASMFGCGVGTVKPRQSHWKEAYSVTIKGARAVEWMRALRPIVGVRRQDQIDRAIDSYAPRSNRRLEDDSARAALEMLGNGRSVKSVAEHFGVTPWCIYDLRLGRTHKHLPRGVHPDGRSNRLSQD